MLSSINWGKNLTAKANPIDIPVDIYSLTNPGSYQLIYKNVLPGTGVTISNLSSVDLKEDINRPSDLNGMKIQFTDEKGQDFWTSMTF